MSPHRTFCGFDGKDDPVNWKDALCTHIQQIVARSGHTKEDQYCLHNNQNGQLSTEKGCEAEEC